MSAPVRVQLSRAKGWRKPENAVVVGRPTKWGNPFRLGTTSALARVPAAEADAPWEYEDRISAAGMRHDFFHADGRVTRHIVRYMTAAEAVEAYRERLTGEEGAAHLGASSRRYGLRDRNNHRVSVEDVRRELRGRDLACWCPLDRPCHADVLLELANEVAS